MRSSRFVIPVLVGVLAFAGGWASRRPTATAQTRAPDFVEPIGVIRAANPGDGSYQLVPFQAQVDGRQVKLAERPEGEEVWTVNLPEARVVLLTTRRPLR